MGSILEGKGVDQAPIDKVALDTMGEPADEHSTLTHRRDTVGTRKPKRTGCRQVEGEEECLGPISKGSSSPKKVGTMHSFINIPEGLLCARHWVQDE